jgi:hypothetical protein
VYDQEQAGGGTRTVGCFPGNENQILLQNKIKMQLRYAIHACYLILIYHYAMRCNTGSLAPDAIIISRFAMFAIYVML